MPPTPSRDVDAELKALDDRLNEFLPPRYQHCYGEVPPTSMGSASLKMRSSSPMALSVCTSAV